MATDYKRRAEPQPSKRHTPCWVWFVSGLMLGVFGCGLAWLKLDPRGPLQVQVPGMPAPKTAAKPAPRPPQTSPPKAPPPRFDFYTLLPDSELEVPGDQPSTAAPNRPTASAQPRTPAVREAYLLQAGAFSRREDAERLRARLALLGVESEIQSVQVNDRERMFRVRCGPYRSRAALDEARGSLQRNGIKSIAIKLEG